MLLNSLRHRDEFAVQFSHESLADCTAMAAGERSTLLINVSPYETRVAVLEDGLLFDIHIERPSLRGLVGNIYKGKVIRVLPGMQAAFVDIGLDRAGFLHVSEVMPLLEEGREHDLNALEADVRRWLRDGQELLVQVIKDPLGTKGARLTTHLSLASRYLVHLPDLQHIGVSIRLDNLQERERLQAAVKTILSVEKPTGYIVRTVAEGQSVEALAPDIAFLKKLWQSLQEKAKKSKAPGVVHEDLPLLKRAIRDMVDDHVEYVYVDSLEHYQQLQQFCRELMPSIEPKLKLHQGNTPLFELHGVEEELQRALQRKVPLKSGGYLVIDHTEAMTTIDVNTGSFVGSSNLEDTIFKTNLEAAQAIGRQLRLRNLGGIIILDFIDMNQIDHRDQLVQTLAKVLATDYAKTTFTPLSPLGLIEMTRKRIHDNLAQQLCEPCPECEGRGRVKTPETLAYEIFRALIHEAKLYQAVEGFLILASGTVVDYLMEEQSQALGEIEAVLARPIKLKADPSYIQERYDIVLI